MRPSEVCPFSLRPWPLGRVMTQLKHHNKVCVVVLYAHWSYDLEKKSHTKKKYSDVNLNFFFENHDFSDIFAGPNFLPILNFWSPKIRQNLAIHFFGKSWNF